MGKNDDKGEPVKTVTIGGKKVEVPIIFILPEETGEKEIERYQHPKVQIQSKKGVPLLAGAGAAAGIGTAAGGIAATGKKIGEGVKNTVGEGIGAVGDAAKLSETLSSESEEEPLDKLTHGKLEEVEKLPFPVPKEKTDPPKGYDWKHPQFRDADGVIGGRKIEIPLPQSEVDENDAVYRHAMGFGFPQERGVKDSIVAGKEEMPKQKEISHTEAEANKGYSDDFKEGGFAQESFEEAPKKKKKKKREAIRDEWSDVLPDESKKDCKGGKCSKKPSKPDYDPSKVADEKFFNTRAEASAVKGATSVLRHRTGLFSPVFGDKKELDRVQAQLKDHNDKNPTFFDTFDPEQSISDLSGESQEKAKGLDSGDDDPRRHGRRPDKDEDVGQHEGRERGHKPDQHKPKRSTIDRLREHQADIKSGKWKPPNDDDIVSLVEDYDEHTDQEKLDIELARRGGKGGKIALPMVERKVRGEKRPSLYGETVGRRSLQAGLTPEQAGQNMHMATISEENAEKYKAWLQKREDWDKEEAEWEQIGNTNRFKKRRKKRLQDVDFDESDSFGIDKLKALQLEIKDALKPEKNQGEMSTAEFGGRSGRNPKTGRELNDYLESQSPYGFGKLGKKEPQTSRGQADDATQERATYSYGAKDPRSGDTFSLKKPAREAGENTVRGDKKMDQHKFESHETPSSGNQWASGRKVPKEMYDQEPISEIKHDDYDKEGSLTHHKIRKVPRGGKAPRDSPQPLGRKAQFTGNEKLMRQMAGYSPEYFEDTYDKEEERRRDAKLPKGGKRPKGTTGKKKSWEKWLEKQAPKDLERGAQSNVPKERMEGQHIGDAGFITEWSQSPEESGQSHGTQSTEERKRSQREEEHKDQVPRWRYEFPLHDPRVRKAWEKWLENKSLGALGWGKLDRKTGKKKKLRRRQPTLDDFPEDNGDKKDET